MMSSVVLIAFALLAVPDAAAPADPPCRAVGVDHAPWTAFLSRYVRDGLVDYAAVKREGLTALDAYLQALGEPCQAQFETWSRPDQLAFLLNAYNAFTLKLIVDHYPVDSIRSIGHPIAFKRRIAYVRISGEHAISLDALENQLVRPRFAEPRVHFALVCAARSCPPLRGEAYLGRTLEQQLDDQANRFMRDPSKNSFDASARALRLSRIFDWFARDFEASDGSVRAFVARYLGPSTNESDVSVMYLDYDWTLNSVQ